MRYLVLEGSAVAASCALLENQKVLGEFFVNIPQTHSQTLLPMVEGLLSTCGVNPGQLDFFAVTRGPGSFTGLRIAMAAVKGMAMAAGKPCVGVSTLEALARNLAGFTGSAAAVMDARCGQVYAGLFSLEDGEVCRLAEDTALSVVELGKLLPALKKPVFLVGDGAELCYNKLLEEPPPGPPPVEWLRLGPATPAVPAGIRRRGRRPCRLAPGGGDGRRGTGPCLSSPAPGGTGTEKEARGETVKPELLPGLLTERE